MPDDVLEIVRFNRAMTHRVETCNGDMLIWFRSGGFMQLEDWTVVDLWELSAAQSVTATNQWEGLPAYFELHPTETSGVLAHEMLRRLREGYEPSEIMDGPNLWRVLTGDRLALIDASTTAYRSIGGIRSIFDFGCCALVFAEVEDPRNVFVPRSKLDDSNAIAVARQAATAIRRMGAPRVLGEGGWTLGD